MDVISSQLAAPPTQPQGSANCCIMVMDARADIYLSGIRKHFPDIELRGASCTTEAVGQMGEVTALFALAPDLTDELIAAAPRLAWVQALTSGTDTIAKLPSLRAGTLVTSSRGIHGPQVAELTLLHMLALARDFPRMLRNQLDARWEKWPQRLLDGSTVTIVGVGVIAASLALKCKALGMRTVGVTASPRPVPGFDEILPRDRLLEAAQADFVVVLMPYRDDTHHLIGGAFLANMPATSFLINVARGGVVDEDALKQVLAAGGIAGAGLDVFDREPLPSDDALWREQKVIVTPHIGGFSNVYEQQVLPVVLKNIEAFLCGDFDAMVNRVN